MANVARPRSDQVEWGEDLGNAVALLDVESEELRSRGIEFVPGHDDLDRALVAFLTVPSTRRYALVRHRGSPVAGTELLLAANLEEDARAVAADLDDVLMCLGLSEKSLRWLAAPVQAARETRARSQRR